MTDIHGVDPRTGRRLDAIPNSTESDVNDACIAAASAAHAWSSASPRQRADIADTIAATLRANAAELIALADTETALGHGRLSGELERTCVQWEQYGQAFAVGELLDVAIDHADSDAVPTPRPDLRKMNVPIGPVAIYAAGNFPFAFSVAGTDTASALVAGCPVIVKAHDGHPATSARVGEIVQAVLADSGHPDVLSVIHGFDAGRSLIAHPAIRAGAFTGSTAGGHALLGDVAHRPEPIPFYGELGSLNPAIVTPGAWSTRRDAIIAGFVASFTLGAGQFCTKPGLLIVPSGDLSVLTEAVETVSPQPLLYERIVTGLADGITRMTAVSGVDTLVSPKPGTVNTISAGLYTADADVVANNATPLLDECFGPVALVATYSDTAALHRLIAALPGGLTGSIHIGDTDDADAPAVIGALASRSGRVIVNQWPTGVTVTWAMHHGGPWPASTQPGHTSVGPDAIRRFLRPVAFQNTPPSLLPGALQDENPWRLSRRVNGALQSSPNGFSR